MKPKIRIQLLSPENAIISDRLVDQYTEFTDGPKEQHKGAFRIEFHIDSLKTVEEAKQYMDKLIGNLEVSTPKVRFSNAGAPKGTKRTLLEKTNDPFLSFKERTAKIGTQDKLLTFMKRDGFVLISSTLSDSILGKNLRDKDKDMNFWAIRTNMDLEDPRKDIYNVGLLIGLKIIGKKIPKIVFYENKEFKGFQKIEWESSSNINFKEKKKGMTFPKEMTIDERTRWRKLQKKVENGKASEKPQDNGFYDKWTPKIKAIND